MLKYILKLGVLTVFSVIRFKNSDGKMYLNVLLVPVCSGYTFSLIQMSINFIEYQWNSDVLLYSY